MIIDLLGISNDPVMQVAITCDFWNSSSNSNSNCGREEERCYLPLHNWNFDWYDYEYDKNIKVTWSYDVPEISYTLYH